MYLVFLYLFRGTYGEEISAGGACQEARAGRLHMQALGVMVALTAPTRQVSVQVIQGLPLKKGSVIYMEPEEKKFIELVPIGKYYD